MANAFRIQSVPTLVLMAEGQIAGARRAWSRRRPSWRWCARSCRPTRRR
ncbi:MAG: hypothetical protein M5U28_09300 [Sandaracinaceae bacterium]|nr:hypothetical protein [Sandaracinaceae bacterium]